MPDSGLHYFQPSWVQPTDQTLDADVCIYGGTAAGVVAAVAAAGRGKSAVILQPGHTLGGMTTGGLGLTDTGKKHVIGGMARRFYRDLGDHYGHTEEVWRFEPSAAQKLIDGYVKSAGVPVHFRQYLDAVEMDDGRIRSIRMLGGLRVTARVFIDATYEGDLLAKAGVSYAVGREANGVYGETIGGVQCREAHQFSHSVDPYLEEGNPQSGTLPQINQQDAAPDGSGDHRIQAYCFRVCMTDDPANRVAWQRPENFDPREYVLATRWFNAEKNGYNEPLMGGHDIQKFDRLFIKSKTDTNNHGPVSSDFIGANYAWPEADYDQREAIFQRHVAYQQGLYWFLANDDSIPSRYREAYSAWGLAGDEFTETGGWPHQLYVREARRMVSDYVLNEHDTQHHRLPEDPVGMGSYNMDSHNCQRFIRQENGRARVLNEGDVQLPPKGPYGVSYRSIVPRRGEAANLFAPVCLSSSHIAYGSVRMEPVFMVLGESAGIAACLAIDENLAAQDLPYAKLQPQLDKAGQVTTWNGNT